MGVLAVRLGGGSLVSLALGFFLAERAGDQICEVEF